MHLSLSFAIQLAKTVTEGSIHQKARTVFMTTMCFIWKKYLAKNEAKLEKKHACIEKVISGQISGQTFKKWILKYGVPNISDWKKRKNCKESELIYLLFQSKMQV